jgi:hypothetical protein
MSQPPAVMPDPPVGLRRAKRAALPASGCARPEAPQTRWAWVLERAWGRPAREPPPLKGEPGRGGRAGLPRRQRWRRSPESRVLWYPQQTPHENTRHKGCSHTSQPPRGMGLWPGTCAQACGGGRAACCRTLRVGRQPAVPGPSSRLAFSEGVTKANGLPAQTHVAPPFQSDDCFARTVATSVSSVETRSMWVCERASAFVGSGALA